MVTGPRSAIQVLLVAGVRLVLSTSQYLQALYQPGPTPNSAHPPPACALLFKTPLAEPNPSHSFHSFITNSEPSDSQLCTSNPPATTSNR